MKQVRRTHSANRMLLPAVLGTLFLMTLVGATPTSADTENTSWASYAVASTQYLEDPTNDPSTWNPIEGPYSAMQATGPANAGGCSSYGRAWVPFLAESPPETEAHPEVLALAYDPPVVSPSRLDIYETDHGGSVVRVEVISTTGDAIVFEGVDTTPCGGVLQIPLAQAPLPEVGLVVGVVIHTQVYGWEGIDAAGLVS